MSLMKFTTKITLYSSYFDLNERLSTKSILNIFQDVASFHAEEIGVGFNDMLAKNLYWVLSRIKFDILKMSKVNQTVIVETWPHEKGRIDFDRDIRFLSLDGEVLLIGTTKWCVIDTVNRRLQRSDNVVFNGEYIKETNYSENLSKIILPEEDLKYMFSHKVRFSDLDRNKHMNNTNYSNLVLNVVNNKSFDHFEINFLNECLLDDEINVSLITTDCGEYVIGKVNDKNVFVSYTK